jgi:hypothetical protein
MREILIVLAVAGAALAQPSTRTYVGAGGCKSSNCHGGTTPLPFSPDSRILGNEFATWSSLDKHTRAYRVLEEPRGKRMGDILKIDASKDKRCTVCHVVGSPENQRSDGVSCEGCHGPASQWKDSHEAKNSHADSVKNKGMIDTRDPQVRSSLCLSCHLGSGERVVDHEMIAAGHPDLAFELDTFAFAQPAHHRPREPKMRVQSWAVGQANGLTESMRLLTTHAEKSWPEFSDLECYQCHHDLRKDSWRIAIGYAGRKPGSLRVNLAKYEVLRVLVATVAPDQRAGLESAFARLTETVSNRFSDGAAIAQSARGVERASDDLTKYFMRPEMNVDPQTVVTALVANIQRIADAGVNAAEQATMSLDALTTAMGKPQTAVTPLYDYLERPSAYTPNEFAARFRKAAGA